MRTTNGKKQLYLLLDKCCGMTNMISFSEKSPFLSDYSISRKNGFIGVFVRKITFFVRAVYICSYSFSRK